MFMATLFSVFLSFYSAIKKQTKGHEVDPTAIFHLDVAQF